MKKLIFITILFFILAIPALAWGYYGIFRPSETGVAEFNEKDEKIGESDTVMLIIWGKTAVSPSPSDRPLENGDVIFIKKGEDGEKLVISFQIRKGHFTILEKELIISADQGPQIIKYIK